MKEISLKICGMNTGNRKLMIREKNKERMPEGDNSIATSWDFILKFIIFFV